jgi:cytochrome c553
VAHASYVPRLLQQRSNGLSSQLHEVARKQTTQSRNPLQAKLYNKEASNLL